MAIAMEVPTVDIHGFASQGYLYSTKNNYLVMSQDGSTEYNEFGINFSSDLTDDLRLGIQIFARDLGELGNDQPVIDWAVADYHYSDLIGVRFGKVKQPFGLYNESRDIDLARTSVLLPQSVYTEGFRDAAASFIGIDFYGRLPGGPVGSVDYQLYGGGNSFEDNNSIAQAFEEPVATPPGVTRSVVIDKTRVKYLYGGQIIWNTPLDGLRLGGSLTAVSVHLDGTVTLIIPSGPPPSPPTNIITPTTFALPNLFVGIASAEYTWRDLVLAAEYSRTDGDIIVDGTPVAGINSSGWYVSAAYRFNPWFELGAAYSVYASHREDWSYTDPRSYQEDATLSARFDINPHWIFKLEAHGMRGAALVDRSDNTNDNGSESFDEHWLFFAAKTTVSF
ncbi:MAG: hypothetical protein H0W72_09190 [Planctomycetes bacterium]|nr:hypothetical protein [Planctomycetota bacterium]